ncbi:MAG: transposase [Treponema sp.]|nr:transposase [Treponema sp.]
MRRSLVQRFIFGKYMRIDGYDIRRAIYTTNAIESLNFSLRKVTRNKSSFPDDDSIYKVMYLAIKNASTRWTMSIKDWGLAVNQFAILFDGRVPGFN